MISSEKMILGEKELTQFVKGETIARMLPSALHEMNNHMTAIAGFTEIMLSERNISDQRAGDLVCLQDAVQKSRTMLSNLRDLASPRMQQEEEEFCPVAATETLVALMSKLIRGKNIEVVIERNESIPLISGKRNDFSMAVFALLMHLVSSSPRGAAIGVHFMLQVDGELIIDINILRKGFLELVVPKCIEPFAASVLWDDAVYQASESMVISAGGTFECCVDNAGNDKLRMRFEAVSAQSGRKSIMDGIKSFMRG